MKFLGCLRSARNLALVSACSAFFAASELSAAPTGPARFADDNYPDSSSLFDVASSTSGVMALFNSDWGQLAGLEGAAYFQNGKQVSESDVSSFSPSCKLMSFAGPGSKKSAFQYPKGQYLSFDFSGGSVLNVFGFKRVSFTMMGNPPVRKVGSSDDGVEMPYVIRLDCKGFKDNPTLGEFNKLFPAAFRFGKPAPEFDLYEILTKEIAARAKADQEAKVKAEKEAQERAEREAAAIEQAEKPRIAADDYPLSELKEGDTFRVKEMAIQFAAPSKEFYGQINQGGVAVGAVDRKWNTYTKPGKPLVEDQPYCIIGPMSYRRLPSSDSLSEIGIGGYSVTGVSPGQGGSIVIELSSTSQAESTTFVKGALICHNAKSVGDLKKAIGGNTSILKAQDLATKLDEFLGGSGTKSGAVKPASDAINGDVQQRKVAAPEAVPDSGSDASHTTTGSASAGAAH